MSSEQCSVALNALNLGAREEASVKNAANNIARLQRCNEITTATAVCAIAKAVGIEFIDVNGNGTGVRLTT